MHKKTKIAFFALGFLAIGQVLWWAHLLLGQQQLITVLNPMYSEKGVHFSRMVLSETIFFIFFWSISFWYAYKSYKEQLLLKKAQSTFLGGFSHELKTPIANIQLCLDTLARPNIIEEKKEIYLQRAQTSLNTLLKQVEDILTFTSLDNIQVPKQKIRILDLIKNQLGSLENITLDIDENIMVLAPQLSSQLVVKNILDNAIKYSQKSENKNILIRAHKEKTQVILSIKDHGIGMTKDEIESSMKPFWRSERAIQEALPGTGMGLTLAQEIALRSQIKIHFESEGIQKGVEAKIIFSEVSK